MAISLIGTATEASGTCSGTSYGTIAYPATIADGDVAFIVFSKDLDEGQYDFDIAGFKHGYFPTGFGTDFAAAIAYRVCDGTESGNIAISSRDSVGTTDDWAATCFILRGVDLDRPFDIPMDPADINFDAGYTPDIQPAVTTLTNGAWVISAGTTDDASVTAATLTGYTQIKHTRNASYEATVSTFYKEIATAGVESPGTISWTGVDTVNTNVTNMTFAVRPAATTPDTVIGRGLPVVESASYKSVLLSTSGSTMSWPAGKETGDLIVLIAAGSDDAFQLSATGFEAGVAVHDYASIGSNTGTDKQLSFLYKYVDGGEAATIALDLTGSTKNFAIVALRISGGSMYFDFWNKGTTQLDQNNFSDNDIDGKLYSYGPMDNALAIAAWGWAGDYYVEGTATLPNTPTGMGTPVLYDEDFGPNVSVVAFVGPVADRDVRVDTLAPDFGLSSQGIADIAGMMIFVTPTEAGDPTASTPTNLAAADGEIEKITLTWDEVLDADLVEYHVYRAESSSVPTVTPLATVAGGTETYVDSSVVVGTEYFYVVTSEDDDPTESAASNEVSATAIVNPHVGDYNMEDLPAVATKTGSSLETALLGYLVEAGATRGDVEGALNELNGTEGIGIQAAFNTWMAS